MVIVAMPGPGSGDGLAMNLTNFRKAMELGGLGN
jgi:hypothetical protein